MFFCFVSNFLQGGAHMMTFESIKTIRDLVTEAGKAYENRVYLRTLRNNMIHDTTFGQFSLECNAIAAWTDRKSTR